MKGQDIVDVQEVMAANGWKYDLILFLNMQQAKKLLILLPKKLSQATRARWTATTSPTLTPQKRSKVSGQKKWMMRKPRWWRPASVKVKILNGDTVVDEQNVASHLTNGSMSPRLCLSMQQAKKSPYTVRREAVPGYTSR